jgi:uncharacterized protein YukE
MAKAQVDPVELVQFAKSLSRFNEQLDQLIGNLRGQMRRLETTWQDQEQRKFSEEFEATVRGLSRFRETSDQHVRVLTQKARYIEQYLNQR